VKIVYSTDNYHPRVSGMATSIDRFRKYLERRGHEVHILAPEYPGGYVDGPRTHRFRSMGLFFTREDRLVRPWEKGSVYKVMDGIGPDIVHVQTEFEMGRIPKSYALKKGIPLAMTCHTFWEHYVDHYFPYVPKGIARGLTRRIMGSFFSSADLMITPTPQMRDVLRDYGIRQEIHVVPTGIDPDEFEGSDKSWEKKASPLFKDHPELQGKKVMAYLGRVGLEKNVDMLIPLLRDVVSSVPDAHLLVTGSGPYLPQMKTDIEKAGMKDHATFTGYVDRSLIKHVLTLADVFTFPSLTETQGLVTGEAMICGTPVVAIGEMGTRFVMGGDNGGFMVPNDLKEFATRTVQLLSDEELWERKSREALEHSRKWSMEHLARRMESLYEAIRKGA